MELIQRAVTAIRKFRKDKKLKLKEEFDLYIDTPNEDLFKSYLPVIGKFFNLGKVEFVSEKIEGTGSLRVKAHQFFIPMGSVDLEAEKEKIEQEITYTQGFLDKVNKKLGNERFVSNAPEKVVALERKKRADAEAKLKVLRESLSQLG